MDDEAKANRNTVVKIVLLCILNFIQDAKKAALATIKAKSQGKDNENIESSMRIFSHLDSNKMMTGHPEGGSYGSPSWPPVYSSAFPTSSLSPGMSDAGTLFPPSLPCGSASPSFPPFPGDHGFSQYLQEQRTSSIRMYH